MSARPYRLPVDHAGPAHGRLIDRQRQIAFTFDGRPLLGFAGDTLASALLANGVSLAGRSFKYHRPRGIQTAGAEEPSALVTVGEAGRATVNQRATMVELHEGLAARSQNRWPSLEFDLGQASSIAARLIPAGFYYKTFMWPGSAWPLYEWFIRRAAGLGPAPTEPDGDTYEQVHVTCDVLVAGGGVAGIAAATAAAESGARVIVAEQMPRLGGMSDLFDTAIDGKPALEWIAAKVAALAARDNVHVLTRTTVAGHYDHNYVVMAERLTDHDPGAGGPDGAPRERLWKVRAGQIVVAAGALERPLAFANNDRPGIMLGTAARAHVRRHGVAPGAVGAVFANNDEGYRTALALAEVGIEVACVIDARADPAGPLAEAARAAGIACRAGHLVANVETARAGKEITAVQVAARDEAGAAGAGERIECDFVCVSGGWNPQGHLTAHAGGRLVWDEAIASMKPGSHGPSIRAAGAANGAFGLAECLEEGYAAGEAAARAALGPSAPPAGPRTRETVEELPEAPIEPVWFVPAPGRLAGGAKHFIDLQNDVTAADIRLAVREGYDGVEHLKRYTTLGMATDQGKIGNVGGLAIHAEAVGAALADLGTTTFRPPYTPLTLGAIAGQQAGSLYQPVRHTPVWHWHRMHRADFEPVGLWRRPYCYRAGAVTREAAITAEIRAVRSGVGVLDASTLGKIEVRGPDAGEFLDRIYSGMMSSLKEGRCRYGLMLSEQGFVFDDGVVARLGPDHFLLHTTSGGADHAVHWLELWLQTEWPDLKVFITPVTEQWAQFAVAGPAAREVIEALGGDIDVSRDGLEFLSWRAGTLAGIAVRLLRISFTGELSYEIACPANCGNAMWEAILKAGEPHAIIAHGTESLHVMRAEKGFIAVGDETDGMVTPHDLGLSWAVSRKKSDFIGKRGLERSDLVRPDRRQLVGLLTEDAARVLPQGGYLIAMAERDKPPPHRMIGHVTSSYMSPTLGRSIAMALVEGGRERHGETIACPVGREAVNAMIVEPVFYDREGERQNV